MKNFEEDNIPTPNELIKDLLEILGDREEHQRSNIIKKLELKFTLSEEAKSKSGPEMGKTNFAGNIDTARNTVETMGLLKRKSDGIWVITENGIQVLKKVIDEDQKMIDKKYLDKLISEIEGRSDKDLEINLKKKYQRIIYGAPGTGKSFLLNEDVKNMIEVRTIGTSKEIDNRNYWLVTCGKDNFAWEIFRKKGIFSIGFSKVKNIDMNKTEPDEIREKVEEYYPGKNRKPNYFNYLINEMEEGDIIVVRKGIKGGEIVGYGVVSGGYFEKEVLDDSGNPVGDFRHNIHVDWKENKVLHLESYKKQFPMDTIFKSEKGLEGGFINAFKSEYLKEKINLDQMERVTFYDGYTYNQFVGSYKPIPSNEESENITYKFVPGPFIKLLVRAFNHPKDDFVLIIEEINRAKVDRVFGDIFQLLDRDKNGNSEYRISISEELRMYLSGCFVGQYDELFSDGLYLPSNFYIWATMNNGDQGVYPMDTAFKRRWNFEYISINQNAQKFYDDEESLYLVPFKRKKGFYYYLSWIGKEGNKGIREIINEELSKNIGIREDRLLGPFFVNKNDFVEDDYVETHVDDKGKTIYLLDHSVFMDKMIMYLFDDVLRHKDKTKIFNDKYNSFYEMYSVYDNIEADYIGLEDQITEEIINSICEEHKKITKNDKEFKTMVVLKDTAFKNSSDKTNFIQILKQAGIGNIRSI